MADFSLSNPTHLPSNGGGSGYRSGTGGFSRSFGGGSFGGGGAAERGGGGGDHAAGGGMRLYSKTQMCKFWTSGKKCPWGDGCNYAHGEVPGVRTRACELL